MEDFKKQFQLIFWNEFKKCFCYCSGLRDLSELLAEPWKEYERLTDISIEELGNIIIEEKIKTIILDIGDYFRNQIMGLYRIVL